MSDFGCFSSQVKYDSEGKEEKAVLLFVNHHDKEIPLQYSHVYLLNREKDNVQLVGDSAVFTSVYDISVSPDYKYLALLAVSEGHPWIEIYDLHALINSEQQKLLAEINPYPGIINMAGWKGGKLIVESDVNLLLKNENKNFSEQDMTNKSKKFSFDIRKNKFMLEK